MVVEDDSLAAKLWWFGRAGETAQINSRDRADDGLQSGLSMDLSNSPPPAPRVAFSRRG